MSLTDLNLGDQFKIYPDQPIFTKSIHGNQIGGEKIFKFALVPFTTGRQTISSISLNYFDPDKNEYNTISTNPISLTIKPGTGTENLKPGSIENDTYAAKRFNRINISSGYTPNTYSCGGL